MHDDSRAGVWSSWQDFILRKTPIFVGAGLAGMGSEPWKETVEHSLVVNATALLTCGILVDNGVKVDMQLVDEASLLHDIARRRESEANIADDLKPQSTIKRDLIVKYGYGGEVAMAAAYVGRVPEMFIEEPVFQKAAITEKPIEHLIVAYSDARVHNTQLVPLDVARDLDKQSVIVGSMTDDRWYDFYLRVEEYLFQLAQGYNPSDITIDGLTSIVQVAYNMRTKAGTGHKE